MIPPFGIEGGVGLAAGRAISVAGLFAAFGGLTYRAFIAPPGLDAGTLRRLRQVAWFGLGLAGAGALVWLLLEASDLAGDFAPSDMWAVLAHTQFGHLLAGRLLLLLLAAAVFSRDWSRTAACLAGLALALQAGESHAMAMYGAGLMLGVAALHLLAGGAWLGGLVPLMVVLRHGSDPASAQAARRFSRLGIACVLVLLVTATLQFRAWIGGLPGLLGTAYGWMAMVKMALFAVLLVFAVRNRRRLTPALPATRAALAGSIVWETGLALAIVLAAGVLTELPPSMHVQPVWPFPSIVSFAAFREDPDYRPEAIWAAAAMAFAAILLLVALLRRGRLRPRVLAAGGAALCVILALPHFSPLLVPAEPTRFFHSTSGFTAASIDRGAGLFASNCAACHGVQGRGDGPAASHLPAPPANLTAAHLWMHRDGELYWWISHGIEAPEGGLAMPAFTSLSDNDIWALVDTLHARNAGLTVQDGRWGRRLHAPDFPITCEAGGPTALSRLQGHVVRLVIGEVASPIPGATTVLAARGAQPGPGLCTADPAAISPAYAIASGTATVADGTEFLIDAHGWLRQTGPASRWDAPGMLASMIANLGAMPAPPAAPMGGMKM